MIKNTMKTHSKWRAAVLLIVTIISLFAVLSPLRAYAVIEQPDSTPGFSHLFANRNLLASGDMLVYGLCDIPYAVEPDIESSSTFSFRFMDSTGTTEYASIQPYVYFSNGYNKIVFSFYFSENTTWGESCLIRLSENPAMFESPTKYNIEFVPTYYSNEVTQAANQAQLAIKIIEIAQDMQIYYTGYNFLQNIYGGGYALASPTGETYFCGAIPMLQYMSPSLFLMQSYSGDIASENWSTYQFDLYAQRFAANWVGQSINATAVQFNLTPMMITGMVLVLPLCIGAVVLSSRKYQRAEPGFIFCSIILIMAAVMGWIPAAVFATINQIEGIYIGYVLFYSRG